MARTAHTLVRLWPLCMAALATIVGFQYGWQLGLGTMWFGLSLAALIWAVRSFRPASAAEFPESN